MKHLKTQFSIACKLLLLIFFSYNVKVHAQTQGIDTVIYAQGSVNGYYVSLPPDYQTNPTKKYSLLIALHGNGEKGDGSATDMPKLLSGNGSIAQRLNNNNFPASFTVDGETFSFIVVCPQYDGGWNKYFLQDVKSKFRVDAERVYLTGLSEGGAKAWHMITPNSSTYTGPDSLTAIFLVAPSINYNSYVAMNSSSITTVNKSNLPVYGAYNTGESSGIKARVDSIVFNLNSKIPSVDPPARKVVYSASGHDAWTKTYNPANTIDSANGYNMYQWFLQYRNKTLIAKAGKDTIITLPTDTVTLSGTKSSARKGRIAAYLWTKIAGPSSFTIASPSAVVTGVSDLTAGTYQFELKVTHDTTSITATDTVVVIVNDTTIIPPAVQTQTKVIQNVSSNIKGYLQSLPVSYTTDTTKRFPLIISLHGEEGVGSGDSTALDTVAMQGIPKLIRDGQFPSIVTLSSGQSYSFIVVSPQFNSTSPFNPLTQLNTLINDLKSNLRVDAERVYMAGLGTGGGLGYTFAVGGTTTTSAGFVDSIAALAGAGSNIPNMNTVRWDRLIQSNLPHWLTHNNGDTVIPSSRSSSAVSGYNGKTPTPSPLAQLTLFNSTSQDSWTTTYDPNYILDSANSYNVYKWMLQYTNKKLVADAGNDKSISTSTSTLDGSKSTARRGRITKYAWTKISGGSVTVASDTNAVTGISGLSNGTYQFQLQVTHTDSTTAKDTVTITVSGVSPRVAAPVVEVAQPAMQTDELLSAKINPTVAQSQVTVVITGRATGKANLQISSMDGKRLQRQSFVKDGTSITRTVNVSSMPAGTYIVEIIVGGKHRKILRFVKQ